MDICEYSNIYRVDCVNRNRIIDLYFEICKIYLR